MSRISVCLLAIALVSLSHNAFAQPGTLKPVKVKEHWGYADEKGRLIIAPRFDEVRGFTGALARVGIYNPTPDPYTREPILNWGLIDRRGTFVVSPKYASIGDFSEGLAAVSFIDPKQKQEIAFGGRGLYRAALWGFIDTTGGVAIPILFAEAGNFSEGLASVRIISSDRSMCSERGAVGYIDRSGTVVIKPAFVAGSAFNDGHAKVSIGEWEFMGRCLCCNPVFRGQTGTVDRNGNFVPDDSPGPISGP
jgi:hypothetical protein